MQEVQTMHIQRRKDQKLVTVKNSRRPANGKIAALGVTLGALALLLPLILICLTVVLFEINHWNLPGVSVYDQSVAWMNSNETAVLIDKNWNFSRKIHLAPAESTGEEFWLSPAELGYWVDPEATASEAASIGRSDTPFADVQAALAGEPEVILPVIYFDEAVARQSLENIAKTFDVSPENASVVYTDKSWKAIPGSPGRRVNIDSTMTLLFENAFTNLVTQSALLVTEPIQPEISDLSPILDEIDSVASRELTLTAYDPILDETLTWVVPEKNKRNWISVDPKTHNVGLSIPSKDVQTLIQTWEADLGEGRSLANPPETSAIQEAWAGGDAIQTTIIHEPTTYQVGAGESLWSISLKLGMPMWHIMNANPGLTSSNIAAGMSLTIPSKNVLLPLPLVETKRIVIDISEQRMTVYEDGQVRNTHIISTGMSDSPTMAGIFQIQTHAINAYASNWDLYMPHFMGIYEAWPGFMNGIHGLPLLSNGQRLWASSLGSPASYGCIILDLWAAEDLYNWADPGVVVEITR